MDNRIIYKRIFLSASVWLFMSLGVIMSQGRSNPFEVKQRLSSIPETEKQVSPTLPSDTTTSANLEGIIDTNEKRDTTKASSAEEINPFEVDHLPLRKNITSNRTKNLNGQLETTEASNGFLFWFLLLSCALLAIMLNTRAKAIGLISKSILNENILKLYYREESTRTSLYLLVLYFIFAINIASLFYLVASHFSGPKGILVYMSILAIVIVVYIIRHVFLAVFGNIFGISKNTQLYSFAILVFNIFLGICLIPLNFILAFGPEDFQVVILWISVLIVLIMVLLRTFRGVFIVSEYLIDRIFQIFIYLCAFEIAPMLILVKFVMKLV
jgi:Domain of unknown function (DUF4271)